MSRGIYRGKSSYFLIFLPFTIYMCAQIRSAADYMIGEDSAWSRYGCRHVVVSDYYKETPEFREEKWQQSLSDNRRRIEESDSKFVKGVAKAIEFLP